MFLDKRVVVHLLPVLMASALGGMTAKLPLERCVGINQVKGVGKVFPCRENSRYKGLEAGEELSEIQALELQLISSPSCKL